MWSSERSASRGCRDRSKQHVVWQHIDGAQYACLASASLTSPPEAVVDRVRMPELANCTPSSVRVIGAVRLNPRHFFSRWPHAGYPTVAAVSGFAQGFRRSNQWSAKQKSIRSNETLKFCSLDMPSIVE